MKHSPHHIPLNEIFRYAATEELINQPGRQPGATVQQAKKTEYASITPCEFPRFLVAQQCFYPFGNKATD
ncbi:hypothetical protein ACVXHB_12395 [Escherichia coli]